MHVEADSKACPVSKPALRQGRVLTQCGVVLAAFFLLWPSPSVWAQTPSAATLPPLTESVDAQRELAILLSDFEAGRYALAAAALPEFADRFGSQLVRIAPGHWMTARRAAHLLAQQIENVPGNGPAIALRDETIDGADRFTLSSTVTQDWLRQADVAFHSGKIEQALTIWERLLGADSLLEQSSRWRFPALDAELRQAVLARLVTAEAIAGNPHAARTRLAQLRAVAPDWMARFAGREGNVVETLDDLLHSSELLADETLSPIPIEQRADIACQMDLVQRLWTVPLAPPSTSRDVFGPLPSRRVPRPTIQRNTVFVSDQRGVRALNLDDGSSAWPYSKDDPGYLIELEQSPLSSVAEETQSSASGGLIWNNAWIGFIPDQTTRSASADSVMLVALELKAQGRLRWRQTIDRVVDQPGWQFSGSLSAANDALLVEIEHEQTPRQAQLLCLEADGSLRWPSPVLVLPSGKQSTSEQTAATTLDQFGTVYWNVSGEYVAAIQQDSGEPIWIRRIKPVDIENGGSTSSGGILVTGDAVIALSSQQVTALDPLTGARLWTERLSGGRHQLLDIVDYVVVVSGDSLAGIDRFTGRTLWQRGGSAPGTSGAGTGLVLGSSLLWPTRDELWTVDARSGTLRQRVFLSTVSGVRGGPLALSGTTLLIAGGDQLAAFKVLLRSHREE